MHHINQRSIFFQLQALQSSQQGTDITFDQHHGARWMDSEPYPLKRLWLRVQYCSFKHLQLTLAEAPLGKSKTCVCLCGDAVDVTSPTSKRKEEEES